MSSAEKYSRVPKPKSEPGSEAAEPSPEGGRNEDSANKMYKRAAKKLDEKGAADPAQAEKMVKDKSR